MKHMKKIILLFVSFWAYGQQMHHQMLSSQGGSNLLTSGVLIKQTIGQQSIVGNYKFPGAIVGQGFQQSLISKSVLNSFRNEITTITYPNPFVGTIYFQFSNLVDEEISVLIYDIHGRMLLEKETKVNNGLLSIDLSTLANAAYLVRFSTRSATCYCKIIKNL